MRPDTSVYFIATVDRAYVKIGCSYNPVARLAMLQRSAPAKLSLIAFAPGNVNDERALHAKFLAHRSHGEWFNGHESIFDLAAAIRSAGEIPADLKGLPGQVNPLNRPGMVGKRTPEQRQRIRDGVNLANARRGCARDAALRSLAEAH